MKNSTYSNTFDNTSMYDLGERIKRDDVVCWYLIQ